MRPITALIAGATIVPCVVSPAFADTTLHVHRWETAIGRPGVEGGGVHALATFDDGNGNALYAAGRFTSAGGMPASRIARWDGKEWSPLGDGLVLNSNPDGTWVRGMAAHDDGSGPALYVVGAFDTAGGVPATQVARWDGTSWSAVGDGFTGTNLRSIASFGGELYIGGAGTLISGEQQFSGIAKWNGSVWSDVGGGIGASSGTVEINALIVADTGDGPALYAGGNFNTAGKAPASSVARWDGSDWDGLTSGVGGGYVLALAGHDDGSGPAIHAAGAGNDVRRWDGQTWSFLPGGLSGPASGILHTMLSHTDETGTSLYVGGWFMFAGMTPARRLARWDGSEWSSVYLGAWGSNVYALATFDDGSKPETEQLFVGGNFRRVAADPANNIAKVITVPAAEPCQTAHVETLQAPEPIEHGFFGVGGAMHGGTAIVLGRMFFNDQHWDRAYFYERVDGDWGLQSEFFSPQHQSLNRVAVWSDHAALSGSGDTLIFERDAEGEWQHVATHPAAGGVAMQGRRLIIGGENVHVLERINGTWMESAVIEPSIPASSGSRVVAIDGQSIIVGAHESAFIYRHDGGKWIEEAALFPDTEGWSPNTGFGVSLAMEGNIAMVGARHEIVGTVYFYEREGGEWLLREKLVPLTFFDDGPGLGSALALSGNVLIAGAPDFGGFGPGAAYIFTRRGDHWFEQQIFVPPSFQPVGTDFPNMLAISGRHAMLGAHRFDNAVSSAGAVFVLDLDDCLAPLIGDFNGDGLVDVLDLLILFSAWGPCPQDGECPEDLDSNGVVDVLDMLILFANWSG